MKTQQSNFINSGPWYHQQNDVIGGWSVTRFKESIDEHLSDHVNEICAFPGECIIEVGSKNLAIYLATLLNKDLFKRYV